MLTKQYCYHNQLLFLKTIIDPAPTHESINTESTKSNTDIEDGQMETSINSTAQNEAEGNKVNKSPVQENLTDRST